MVLKYGLLVMITANETKGTDQVTDCERSGTDRVEDRKARNTQM